MTKSADLLALPFATMSDLIRAHAEERPTHRALIDGERVLTFADLDGLVDRAAAAFQRDGLKPRDVAAICATSSNEYVTAFIGALRAGLVVSPLSPSSTPEQLTAMVRDCGAKILFLDEAVSTAADNVAEPLTLQRIGLEGAANRRFGDWLAPAGAKPTAIAIDPDQAFNIIYSSGTTGMPKGIIQPHQQRWGHVKRGENNGYGPTSVTIA